MCISEVIEISSGNLDSMLHFSLWGTEMQKQEVKKHGVTGKFGHGVQNEAGQRLIEFCQENELA